MERIPLQYNSTGKALMLTAMGLLALGVVMVHSAVASVGQPGPWYSRIEVRHTMFAVTAFLVLLTLWRVDYRWLSGRGAWPLPAMIIFGLAVLSAAVVYIPGVGKDVGGDIRWIPLGPAKYGMGFQPSEVVKLTLPIFLAAWLSRKTAQDIRKIHRTFIPAAALIGLCVGLIATQNFSTALLVGITSVTTLFLAGVPIWQLLLLVPPAAGAVWVLVVNTPHRWARILAWQDPWSQTNPTAYQPAQSLQAIISGGWFGRGPGNGIHKLGFLPEDTTDFIFSVLCEEWGFIGAALLIGLLIFWGVLVAQAARQCRDSFGRLLAASIGFLIAAQAALHIGVALVALPPTGFSLPLVSAGGTGLLMMAAAVSVIISVTSRSEDPSLALEGAA